jgi:cobalt/nickel transport system permease protein
LSVLIVTFIWRRVKNYFSEKTVPKVALLAAFLFVAQMINIPVAGGTSTHLAGATLAVLITGPEMAIFIMVLILSVQMLVFQDGGLLAWGANVFNIGIAPVLLSYLLFSLFAKLSAKYTSPHLPRMIIIFFIAWLSTQAGAALCGLELGLSGLAPLEKILSLMIFVHSGIGILEGILTVLIYELIRSNRPDLVFFYVPHNGMINE